MVGVMRFVLPSYSGNTPSRTAFAMPGCRPHTTIGIAAMVLFGVKSAAGSSWKLRCCVLWKVGVI